MRIHSIDAMRGLTVAAMLPDFIFPIFMLIVGVSIELSLGRKLDAGGGGAEPPARCALARAVLLRGLRIVLLGIALNIVAALLLHGRGFRRAGALAD
jgi:uncharacterized membrane protein